MAAVLMSSVHGQKFAPSGARLGGSVRASDKVLLARPAHPAARRHPARGRAPRRTVTPPSAVGGPLFETALVLPALVPTLVRGALAGVVVYSTLQWSFARKFRKEAQKQLDEDAVGETDRQERLRRLQGIKDADNGKDGKSE